MARDTTRYSALKPTHSSYFLAVLALFLLVILGGYCAYTMDHAGHHITGMNNRVVWGVPHVFAITLIVAASGVLNGASLSSVFNIACYKPYARVSVVLATALLTGGLTILVMDLGRPDRLIVAMSNYNFRSIFTWNIFLYTGFIVLAVVYLWIMMEPRVAIHTRKIGILALSWRIVLTTGTGSIFGFLVARNTLDSALLAPLFIALSLSMGTAILALVLSAIAGWRTSQLSDELVRSISRLLLWFLVVVTYFSMMHHISNLYVAEHQADERFFLMGSFSTHFWIGHIALGTVLPIALLLPANAAMKRGRFLWACITAVFGGAMLIYVIVIGSQSTPQRLFPDKTVVASRFGDSGFAHYSPSVWEIGLGIGGLAMAFLLCLVLLRILPFTPVQARN